MEMNIPGYVNANYLAEKAALEPGWTIIGTDPRLGIQRLSFMNHKLTAVEEALETYDVDYLAFMKLQALEEIALHRREAELKGPFGIVLDDRTVGRLTAAEAGLRLNPDVATVDWELSRGNFQTMPRAQVIGLCSMAFLHVQQCFQKARQLSDLVKAVTLPELEEGQKPGHNLAVALLEIADLPINEGWPVVPVQ